MCHQFLIYLLTLGFVTHKIIPETIPFTILNHNGACKNIYFVAVGTNSWLVFLCEREKGGTAYKACLHNPVQDIRKLAECVKGDQIRWTNGLIYCYGISSVLVFPIEKKYSTKFVIGGIQSKKTLTEKLKMVNLSVDGTVAL